MSLEFNIHSINYKNESGGGGEIKNQNKTVTENGVYTADSGYTGLGRVTVNVETTEPTLIDLTITPSVTSQTITPLQNTDGYNTITVEAVTANIDSDIQAENIKKDVEILGVTGTYEGITPSGTITITQNGTSDVTNYASAEVNVSGGSSEEVVRGNWIVPQQYLNIDEETGNKSSPEYLIAKEYADSDNDIVSVVGFTVYNGYYTFKWTPPTGHSNDIDRPSIIKISDGRVFYASYLGQQRDSYNSEQTITIDNSDGNLSIYFYYIDRYGISQFWSGGAIGRWTKGTLSNIILARFIKYFAINGTITSIKDNCTLAYNNAESFNILAGSVIPKNEANATKMWNANRSSVSNYSMAKYYPPITEWASTNQITNLATNTFTSNRGLPPMPDGLDLSNVTNDITFGYTNAIEEELFVNKNYRMYCKLPAVNITMTRNLTLTNDNWEYIATNAPSVVGKTLSAGAENISIMGGSSGTIIQTLVNKGWTVN